MKVCVVGAGAIGGWLAARLGAQQPESTRVLARGVTLAAIKQDGLKLTHDGHTQAVHLQASDQASALGPQDLVILAVKAQGLPGLAASLGPLMHDQTVVLPAINGVPWWFCHGLGHLSPALVPRLTSVDPDGSLEAHLDSKRIVGCVVHASASVQAPGTVHHRAGNMLIVGEPDGTMTPRLAQVQARLSEAGFDVEATARIRQAIWYKLWGNLTMNPASALTRATMDKMLEDPLVRAMCSRAMLEAAAIGERLGCPIDQTPEDRHVVTAKLGPVKTSMLQDMEAGRTLELEGVVGAVREIGQRLGLPTPTIDDLHGLARVAASAR